MSVAGGRFPRWAKIAIAAGAAWFVVLALFGHGRPLGFRIVCDASGGMEPTFRPGECVLTGPTTGRIERGDIIAYRGDERDAAPRFARAIAEPGEGVELRDGVLAVLNARISPQVRTGGRVSPKSEKIATLPPQEALSPWIQSNSSSWREIWPCKLSYEVFWLDGGDQWSRRSVSARLGPGAYFVAPDNRDGAAPGVIGGSAMIGRAIAIVWPSNRARLFTLPNASPRGEGADADWDQGMHARRCDDVPADGKGG